MTEARRHCVESGPYRYVLSDTTGLTDGPANILWCMLNPSTANANQDDPTSRKVAGFSARMGFTRWTIVNLYAYRATDPADLHAADRAGVDIFGPENLDHIRAEVSSAKMVMAAWGTRAGPFAVSRVAPLLRGAEVKCLGVTKDGCPRHPLFVPYERRAAPWAMGAQL